MLRNIILLLIICLPFCELQAQDFTLTGRVVDSNDSPIELASVSCLSQGKATMTDLKGRFSITLRSADSVAVKFSMIGYKSKTRILRRPRGKQTLKIILSAMDALDEVVVTEKRRQTTATEQLDVKNLKDNPSVSGNAVEELIQQQAGVSTHNELSSQYNVRGGSFDENSVYINNVEIYRPLLIRSGQQEGLSIINPDMVEAVGFSSGGFEAKYGDKRSSAVDITYRRPTRSEASATVSLLGGTAFAAMAATPLSMSPALRYKTIRYLLGALETKGEYRPNYLD